jgi:hypothetical protein
MVILGVSAARVLLTETPPEIKSATPKIENIKHKTFFIQTS